MSQRKKTAKLLEEGRSLLDRKLVDRHYQEVSSSVLEEVPFVHLGFFGRYFIYRKDRLKRTDETSGIKMNGFVGFEKL
jgi:hypothetical protein